MKNSIKSTYKRIHSLIYYGALLFKIGSFRAFWHQFTRQIYSRFTEVGFSLDIQKIEIPHIKAEIDYTLKLASNGDMKDILEQAKSEDKKMVHKLLFRKMLYDDGYHNCYIARTTDTNEICSLTFTIYSWDDATAGGRFRSLFPRLKEDEAVLEGVYTFEKLRGNRLHNSILAEQIRDCQKKGIKNIRIYIEKSNEISMKAAEKMGFKRFEEVDGRRLLFRTRARFNPTRQDKNMAASGDSFQRQGKA
jgi:hypothetical protein